MHLVKGNWGKPALALLLMLTLVLGGMPIWGAHAALAADTVSGLSGGTYRAYNPDGSFKDNLPIPTGVVSGAIAVTNATTTIGDGTTSPKWYYVSGSVTTTGLVVSGNAHLILLDNSVLTANGSNLSSAGINVVGTNSLTIYAQSTGNNRGQLLAQTYVDGWGYGAGIGGGQSGVTDGGTVTINGGTVTANGGDGAGIGGGYTGAGGTVTINDGTVTATGEYSAGIGSGLDGDAGGTVTINGGAVTATGGGSAAGIGGSYDVAGGIVTINGGIVTATGGDSATGIGSGGNGAGGTVTINGGTVTATGGHFAAGIGSGSGDGGTVTISGGTVTATGGYYSAGIGSGYNGAGGTVTISGGTVTAYGDDGAASIGGGQGGAGGTVTISGGTVTATGTYYSRGIGGGAGGGGDGTLTVSGGAVYTSATQPTGANLSITGGGLLFSAGILQFTGATITLTADVTLPDNRQLTILPNKVLWISEGVTLTIPSDTVLQSDGSVVNYGTLMNNGIFSNLFAFHNFADSHLNNNRMFYNDGDFYRYEGSLITGDGEWVGDLIPPMATDFTFTPTSGTYNGTQQGVAVTPVAGVTGMGSITVYYTGTSGTNYAKSFTPPTDAGTYAVTIDVQSGTKIYDSATGLSLRDYTINKITPTLTLAAEPQSSQTHPGDVTLTAALTAGGVPLSGQAVVFLVNDELIEDSMSTTDDKGHATYTVKSPTAGTYSFGAAYPTTTNYNPAIATPISDYTVEWGTQDDLNIVGLESAYTYGHEPVKISTSGGSGTGAVTYHSSDSTVASVSGDMVTIHKKGDFEITATRAGDANYNAVTKKSGTVTVNAATPDVALELTGGADFNDPLILTTKVSAVGVGEMPTGTVTFSVYQGTVLAEVELEGSGVDGVAQAIYTIPNPTGSHTYTATYNGKTDKYNTNADREEFKVGLAKQAALAITDIPSTITYGDAGVTLSTSGGSTDGAVTFAVASDNGVLDVTADGNVTIVGAGTVRVKATMAGDANYNSVSTEAEITVLPRDISNATITVTGTPFTYSGTPWQPKFSVTDGDITITSGDYTNRYGANVNAGTGAGSVTLTGKGNYAGAQTVVFDIAPLSLNGATITLADTSFTATGSEIEPKVTVVDVNGITVPATDYKVSYSNNVAAGTATVTVTATGTNFTGSASTTFAINQAAGGSGSTGGSGGVDNATDTSSPEPTPSPSVESTPIPAPAHVIFNDLVNESSLKNAVQNALASAPVRTFNDVPADSWSADAITIASQLGFVGGYGDGSFRGNQPITRAEFSAMLVRALGLSTTTTNAGFNDTEDHWASSAINTLAALGIIYGYDNDTFKPDKNISRAEMAAILARVLNFSMDVRKESFADVASDNWAATYIENLAGANIVNGTGNDKFNPTATATRAESVVMILRMLNAALDLGLDV
ncbi:S-layer homology domain-containing protein [Paenibacillus sp. B01]|uniref:S-layer homology domain-containing protein n=1 Tax=Paenibacillus sp. B01 TaxID=2660554 RepID=UPI00129BCFB2|nr:S-layer homology domain-containing protein [Paenibacillus sp. B01]QGG58412.1 hypothetical protein GE073_24410 [Paenibacillus sp. B01]